MRLICYALRGLHLRSRRSSKTAESETAKFGKCVRFPDLSRPSRCYGSDERKGRRPIHAAIAIVRAAIRS
jgi:hypothetical protein